MPRFSPGARPVLLPGEAVFPWMFEQEKQLKPFRGAVETMMQDTRFGVSYDESQLARNEVPLRAAVSFDDKYVDSSLSLDTLSRIGEKQLKPFRGAVETMMQDTRFGVSYDESQLARNEVPLRAAVSFDDKYVDSSLSLDTLSRIGNAYAWVPNEFEHDRVHGATVFRHLFDEACANGDLRAMF